MKNAIRQAPVNPKGSLTDRKLKLRRQADIEESATIDIDVKGDMMKRHPTFFPLIVIGAVLVPVIWFAKRINTSKYYSQTYVR